MYYTEPYHIASYLCDASDHLTMWGLARLFQEVAEGHTSKTHIGFHDLMADNKAWVLSRMYYEIHQMPVVGDDVMLTTWSRGTDGLFAMREFKLENGRGVCYAAATAYWVVMDFGSRRVVRLHDLMSNYEHHPETATSRSSLDKLKLPEISSNALVDEISIKPSMLDHTAHVNNSEYVKWIFDNIEVESNQSQICPPSSNFSFEINYLLETQPNETASIFRIHDNNTSWFQITNSRGISAQAAFILHP